MGGKVADDYADFYDGSWDSMDATSDFGIKRVDVTPPLGANDPIAATGSNSDGTRHATAYAGASSVRWGGQKSPLSQADDSRARWPIYALSPILTVPQPPEPEPKPAKPTGLTATGGNQQVTLSWNDPDDSRISSYGFPVRVETERW